ncbi:hypothetical protein D3C72_2285710 [compost metagenome]
MVENGFLDVGLPDAQGDDAVARDARWIDQAHVDGAGADRRGEVAAVAAPVHKRLVYGHLAEQVVHVMAWLRAS